MPKPTKAPSNRKMVPSGTKEYETRQHHVLATTGKPYSGNDTKGKPTTKW